jgi:hypothetical protein
MVARDQASSVCVAARSLPFIHDVTTDMQAPSAYVAVLPLRADAPIPPAYAGEEVARLQRDGHPDIQPLRVTRPVADAFDLAIETARQQGREIVAAVPDEGRIEATDTTTWFGFKDDVVIFIKATGDGFLPSEKTGSDPWTT